MPVTAAKSAPYAPSSAIIDLIKRHRERCLPSPVNAEVLGRASIPDSLIPRTLQALQVLDLIDKDGTPTQAFEGLRLSPEAEFRDRMAAWVRAAYADVFTFVDPAAADATRVRDAFRSYQPAGQQERMVSLFMGLCAAAGLLGAKSTPERAPRGPRPARAAPSFTPQQRAAADRVVAKLLKKPLRHSAATLPNPVTELPPAIAGLHASLPDEGNGWTQPKRDLFMTTFGSVLDFCFPSLAHNSDKDGPDEEAA
jgi:hypothetical protein